MAESLTGGLLAATIVEIPGVSAVFRGGLVVYATDLKASLAGVPAESAGRARTGRSGRGARPGDGRPRTLRGATGAWPPPASPARSRRTASRSGRSSSRSRARATVRACRWRAGSSCAATGRRSGRAAVTAALRAVGRRSSTGRPAEPGRAGRPAGFGGAGCRRGPQRVRLREASGACRWPRRRRRCDGPATPGDR